MARRYSVLLKLSLLGVILIGCNLPEPYEYGEPCEGMTSIYIDSSTSCEGESCKYAKYIEFQICPADYPYCIRSFVKKDADGSGDGDPQTDSRKIEQVFCALECVKDTFQRDTVSEAYRSADADINPPDPVYGPSYCQTSTLEACGGEVNCKDTPGWKSGSCDYKDNKSTCVAGGCDRFYKLDESDGGCQPYANCCGTSCGKCAWKPAISTICTGVGPDAGCQDDEHNVAACTRVENGQLVEKGGICAPIKDENGNPIPNTGVFICPLRDGNFCGTVEIGNNGENCDKADLYKVCASDEYCSDGVCEKCPEGQTNCGNVSCDIKEHIYNGGCEADSPEHCGIHENNCLQDPGVLKADCSLEQQCVITACHDGYTLHDGACVESVKCCGPSCANCSENEEKPFCSNNECVSNCPETDGIIVCDGTCIDSKTSLDYCGSTSSNGVCEKKGCNEHSSCVEGECKCNAGWHEYNNDCEEDTVENCGAHDNNCLSDNKVYRAECNDTVCNVLECHDGFALKEGQCVPENECCGTGCQNCSEDAENPYCLNGSCAAVCNPDETTSLISCNFSCIDAQTSNTYCGATSTDNTCTRNDCSLDRTCVEGTCKCLPGFHESRDKSKCEEDTVKACGGYDVNCTVDPGVLDSKCENAVCVTLKCHDGYVKQDNQCKPSNECCGASCEDCTDTDKPLCLNGTCVAKCVVEEPVDEPDPENPNPTDDPEPADPEPADPKPIFIACEHACIDVTSSNSYCGIQPSNNNICKPKVCAGELICKRGECKCENDEDLDCDGHCVAGNTVQHCGSCALDCTAIPGVGEVSCNIEAKRCDIASCAPDFHLAKDDNGESLNNCVPDSATSCGSDAEDCTGKFENAVAKCEAGKCAIESCVSKHHQVITDGVASCVEDSVEACGEEPVNCTELEGWSEGNCSDEGKCVATACVDGYDLTEGQCVKPETPEPEE